MKLFDLFATLTLDSGGFEKGLSDAQKRVKAFSESVKAGVQTAMKIGAAVAAAGAAIGGYIAKTGISYTAELENYEAQLGVLMGGADKAAEKMKDLSEMAAKTPYDLSNVADAAAKLLTVGKSSDTVTDTVRRLGDIALGSKDKLSRLTDSLFKMKATGQVTTDTLRTMQESGFDPLTLIAEKYKMTQENVNKALSDGKIPLSEIEWAIRKATDAGGQFFNGSAVLAETFNGRLATLKENWRAFLGQLTKPAYDVLKDTVLPYAIDLVDRLSKALDENGIQGVLSTAQAEIEKFSGTIVSKVTEYFDSDQAKTDLQNATGKIAKLLTGGNIVLSDVTSFITNILSKINDTFADDTVKANLASTGEKLIKGILAFEEGKIKTIISGLTVVTNVATGLLQGVSDYFSSEEGKAGITNIISSLGNAIANLGQTAINAVPALVSAGAAIYEGIVTAAANNIINFFDKFSVDDFLASASAWWAKVKPGLEKILQANVTITYKIYKKVAGAVLGEDTVQEIESTNERMQQVSDQLQEDGVDIVSGATPTGQEVLDAAEKVNQKYGSINPRGFATGLYSVPYDNFPALLHRKETVLTRAQADEYRKGRSAEAKQDVYNINIQSTAESPSETAAYIKQAMRTLRFNQA